MRSSDNSLPIQPGLLEAQPNGQFDIGEAKRECLKRRGVDTVSRLSAHRRADLRKRTFGATHISCGYWSNESNLGTFDHHGAGWVAVRPGQGIAGRCGASQHGTAESRGGRGRGRNRGLSLCAARGAQGLPLRGRAPLGQLLRSPQGLESRPPGVAGGALRRGDRGVRGAVKPRPAQSGPPTRSWAETGQSQSRRITETLIFDPEPQGSTLAPRILDRQSKGPKQRGIVPPRGGLRRNLECLASPFASPFPRRLVE